MVMQFAHAFNTHRRNSRQLLVPPPTPLPPLISWFIQRGCPKSWLEITKMPARNIIQLWVQAPLLASLIVWEAETKAAGLTLCLHGDFTD